MAQWPATSYVGLIKTCWIEVILNEGKLLDIDWDCVKKISEICNKPGCSQGVSANHCVVN